MSAGRLARALAQFVRHGARCRVCAAVRSARAWTWYAGKAGMRGAGGGGASGGQELCVGPAGIPRVGAVALPILAGRALSSRAVASQAMCLAMHVPSTPLRLPPSHMAAWARHPPRRLARTARCVQGVYAIRALLPPPGSAAAASASAQQRGPGWPHGDAEGGAEVRPPGGHQPRVALLANRCKRPRPSHVIACKPPHVIGTVCPACAVQERGGASQQWFYEKARTNRNE